MTHIRALVGIGILALAALGCMRSSEDTSAARKSEEPVTGPAAARQVAPQQADEVAKPPAQGQKVDMSTNNTVTIKGLASVEHRQNGDTFAAYEPRGPVPTPIKAGDRLRLQLEVADDAWIYAVAAFQQSGYWKVGEWGPGVNTTGKVRIPWPEGHIITGDEARMTTLFVIASAGELPWARDLTREDCSDLVGKMPSESPQTACDHLYGLFWKVPKRIRGKVPPRVERLKLDSVNLPAIVSEHSGSPYTAVEWLFKPRQ